MVGRMKGVPTLIKTPFNTLGSVIDAELELDEEELLVETLRTFMVATSSETCTIEIKSFWTTLKRLFGLPGLEMSPLTLSSSEDEDDELLVDPFLSIRLHSIEGFLSPCFSWG